jgi:hypothetical protein
MLYGLSRGLDTFPDQDAEDRPFLCRPQATMLYHQKRCVLPSRLHSAKGASSAGCGKLAPALVPRPLWFPEFFLQIARKQRADERTRTAYPCSSYECAVSGC